MRAAVIRLTPNDAGIFLPFRRQMLSEAPWAFASSLEDDFALDIANVQKSLAEPDNAILAIKASDKADALSAAAGIFRIKEPQVLPQGKALGRLCGRSSSQSGFGSSGNGSGDRLSQRLDGCRVR